MHADDLEFHNVAELRPADGRDGRLLQRVPEEIRERLNEGAQDRMRHPAGVELRFVSEDAVEVTLSTMPQRGITEGTVQVFWGPSRARRSGSARSRRPSNSSSRRNSGRSTRT